MTSFLDALIQKKLLFVTGKGGIGKTLLSAVLGSYAVKKGLKVCLVEQTATDQVPPLFGKRATGHHLSELASGLYSINLNSNDNFRDFVVKHLGYEKLFTKIFSRGIVQSFVRMLPGLAELTLLGRLYYTAELADEHFDLVIFDGYSSGHFHNLMTTPQAIMESGLVGPVLRETENLMKFLKEEKNAGTLVVTNAEPLVMSELEDFIPKFRGAGLVPVSGVILNRYLDESGVLDDLERVKKDVPEPVWSLVRGRLSSHSGEVRKTCSRLGFEKFLTFKDYGAVPEPLPIEDLGQGWGEIT